jgi:Tol biopolymer transport system component
VIDTKSGRRLQSRDIPDRIADERPVFSPDGKTLAFGTQHGLCLWQISTGHVRRLIWPGSEGSAPLTFTPDGKKLSVGRNEWVFVLSLAP